MSQTIRISDETYEILEKHARMTKTSLKVTAEISICEGYNRHLAMYRKIEHQKQEAKV